MVRAALGRGTLDPDTAAVVDARSRSARLPPRRSLERDRDETGLEDVAADDVAPPSSPSGIHRFLRHAEQDRNERRCITSRRARPFVTSLARYLTRARTVLEGALERPTDRPTDRDRPISLHPPESGERGRRRRGKERQARRPLRRSKERRSVKSASGVACVHSCIPRRGSSVRSLSISRAGGHSPFVADCGTVVRLKETRSRRAPLVPLFPRRCLRVKRLCGSFRPTCNGRKLTLRFPHAVRCGFIGGDLIIMVHDRGARTMPPKRRGNVLMKI